MIIGPNPSSARFFLAQSSLRFRSALTYGVAIFICVAVCALSVSAQEQLTSGSSSKTLRKQTVKSLPLQKLNQQTRDKITEIVNKPSIYRRLPVTAISADPDHFRFLVRYPEVIVNIWQLMGVTQMETQRTGPYTIKTNDGAGTLSSLELVYGTENLHIFYGNGTYEGPVLKRKLSGDCVLVLRSESQLGRDGKPVQTSQLDVFLKVRNATAGLIAKTIQPLVGTTADHNFVESLKFVQRLNETTAKNGPGVEQMSQRLEIDPEVRKKYAEVIDLVFQRAINSSAPGDTRALRPSAQTQPARSLNPRDYSNTSTAPARGANYQTQQPIQRQTAPQRNARQPSSSSMYGVNNDYGQNQRYQNGGQNPLSSLMPSQASQPPIYQASQLRHMNASGLPARGNQPPSYANQMASGQYAYPAQGYSQQAQQQSDSRFKNPNYDRQAYGQSGYQTYPTNPEYGQRPVQAQYENYGNYGGPSSQSSAAQSSQIQPAGGWRGR